MKQEKFENLIKKFYLKDSFLVLVMVVSVYFWVSFLESNFLKIAGAVINITGLVMWWWAKRTLASNWNIGFGKPKINQLVTHGIYSKIRHPIYWGVNLTFLGLIFLFPNIWFSILGVLIIIYFFFRMRVENNYLSRELGVRYGNYKKITWF
jgi:protein-S-isoprenylcysteine O-methyltransferase Ste14